MLSRGLDLHAAKKLYMIWKEGAYLLTITLEVLFLEWKKLEEEALQTEVGGIET
jgi:hypothetical protein